jgi:hypothetical protein
MNTSNIAHLLIGTAVLEIQICNADYHRGRVMATGIDGNGRSHTFRFTKRQDGSYRLKGEKDGILVQRVVA